MPPTNRQPTAVITGPLTGRVGALFEVDISHSSDPEGKLRAWRIEWPDGTSEGGDWPPDTPFRAHMFPAPIEAGDVVLMVSDHRRVRATASLTGIVIAPAAEPPAPIDCVMGEWRLDTAGAWGACQPDGTQSRIETWTRDILLEPANGGAACGPTEESRIGLQTCVYVPPPLPPDPNPSSHPYFARLTADARLLYAFPLRSQAELDTYETGGNWGPVNTAIYDPAVDALLQYIDPAHLVGPSGVAGTGNGPRQKFLPLIITAGTSFLQTWDHYYDTGWVWQAGGTGRAGWVDGYKSYRWDLPKARTLGSPPMWLSLKDFFKEGAVAVPSHLADRAFTHQTTYWMIPPTTQGSLEKILPATRFWMEANRWTRTWVYYDAPNQQISAWFADTTQGIVQTLDRVGYAFPPEGLIRFRFEYDTSENWDTADNPLAKIWNRNCAILRDLTYDEVQGWLTIDGL